MDLDPLVERAELRDTVVALVELRDEVGEVGEVGEVADGGGRGRRRIVIAAACSERPGEDDQVCGGPRNGNTVFETSPCGPAPSEIAGSKLPLVRLKPLTPTASAV
jgi:hypothetical protein